MAIEFRMVFMSFAVHEFLHAAVFYRGIGDVVWFYNNGLSGFGLVIISF